MDTIDIYGTALLRLAHLVGLRQIDIAQHFGITRVQVNQWAHGVRRIPEATVPRLVETIAQAVERTLQTQETESPLRAELTAALRDVFAENCYRYGHAEVPTLEAFMEEVRRYSALTQPQRREGPRLEHMEKLAAIMRCWFGLHAELSPLLDLLPDGDQPAEAPTDARQRAQTI